MAAGVGGKVGRQRKNGKGEAVGLWDILHLFRHLKPPSGGHFSESEAVESLMILSSHSKVQRHASGGVQD